MGRKMKYVTNEDKINARRERQMRYYWKNKEVIRHKNLNKYYEKKTHN